MLRFGLSFCWECCFSQSPEFDFISLLHVPVESRTRPLGLDEGLAGDGVDLCWMDGGNTLERILVNRTKLGMYFQSINSEIKFFFLLKTRDESLVNSHY